VALQRAETKPLDGSLATGKIAQNDDISQQIPLLWQVSCIGACFWHGDQKLGFVSGAGCGGDRASMSLDGALDDGEA
jgi:hypothetical protein